MAVLAYVFKAVSDGMTAYLRAFRPVDLFGPSGRTRASS